MIRKSFQIKIGLALLLIFLLPTLVMAASVTLRWRANQEPDIAGYNFYYGRSSRSYGAPIPVGNTTSYTIDNLTEGTTYYFALTATDTSGNESGYSSEVTANATSSDPANESYRLIFNTLPSLTGAAALNGQTISGDVYIALYPEAYVSQVTFSIDGSTHTRDYYAPYALGLPFDSTSLSNGSHTISAVVRLQDGSTETVRSTCSVANSTQPGSTPPTGSDLQSIVLSTSLSDPQPEGQAIELTAETIGGNTTYEYSFYYRKRGKSKWHMLRDFSTDPSITFDSAGKEGKWDFRTKVRAQNNPSKILAQDTIKKFKITKNVPSGVSISSNLQSPQQPGATISFQADAEGGLGNYEYAYQIREKKKGQWRKWKTVETWSFSPYFIWSASERGSFKVRALARIEGAGSGKVKSSPIKFKIK